MPWILLFIYNKGDREPKMNDFVAALIAIFAMCILWKINELCIQWIVDINKLKSSESSGSWFVENYDTNSAATLFVGIQWCVLYVLKGWLLKRTKEHVIRLNRVFFMLVGTLVSALGLPWGFPILVALGELYFSGGHGSSKVRDGGGS